MLGKHELYYKSSSTSLLSQILAKGGGGQSDGRKAQFFLAERVVGGLKVDGTELAMVTVEAEEEITIVTCR